MEIEDAKCIEITVDDETFIVPKKPMSITEWACEHTPWIEEALNTPREEMVQKATQLGHTESMIVQVKWALEQYDINVTVMTAAESRIRERFKAAGLDLTRIKFLEMRYEAGVGSDDLRSFGQGPK